jgi:formate dehydrogenase subunit gamma
MTDRLDQVASRYGKPAIERYSAMERSNHWLVAVCFALLALSGLALFHPSMFWLSMLFGGGPWTRVLHPFIGLLMFVSFVVLAARFWRHNLPGRNDLQWLGNISNVLRNREDRLPAVGRYNAGQKLLFFTMIGCMLALLATGVVIWRAYFSQIFSITAIRTSALIHAFLAFVLICSIIVHIYAGLWVKGTMGAMIRGTVSYGWAKHNHRAWHDEIVESERKATGSGNAPE